MSRISFCELQINRGQNDEFCNFFDLLVHHSRSFSLPLCFNNQTTKEIIIKHKKNIHRHLCLSLFFLCLPAFLPTLWAERVDTVAACPEIHIEAEHLPDLNVARCGHTTILAGNEPLVVGGHTTGFVPTPTAEYYHDGQWHLITTVYTHDEGFAIPMRNGKVLIAGGHEQHLGIGHIFALELYDPQTHTFEGYGCLDKKRTWAECMEMDSGKVIISGNWYADDGIECYQDDRQCMNVKDVSCARTLPYIFRTGRDDAIILGGIDEHGEPYDTIVIDRLKGDAFTLPFFEQWKPLSHLLKTEHRSADSFIGDETTGQYDYLMAVSNQQGQVAIAQVHNGQFSILPTVCPIPTRSQFGAIKYFTTVIIDRQAHRGYIVGNDENLKRLYVLAMDYTHNPAPLTLYYTDTLEIIGLQTPILTPEGNLLIAGGFANNNFTPQSSALVLHVSANSPSTTAFSSLWLLIGMLGLVALGISAAIALRRRKKDADNHVSPVAAETAENAEIEETAKTSETADATSTYPFNDILIQRIVALMEEERMFLRNDLKVADMAEALHTSSRTVSECIKAQRGHTFTQFVNGYRIEHAKQLMQNQPDTKMITIALNSGFTNETSFFRTFKAFVGKTPSEWMSSID